ncbi:SH3 domain-containing protein [Actinokineospora sp. NPDC004072]
MLVPKRALLIGGVAVVAVIYSMGVDRPGGEAAPTGGEGACKVIVTADVLNVRAAPSRTAEIVGKFKMGAETVADRTVDGGFRKLGPDRWAAEEFLKPLPGHDC